MVLALGSLTSCNKAVIYSKDREMEPISKIYSAPVVDVYKSAHEVLTSSGYKIQREDPATGKIITGWLSTKATSHYVDLFDHRDYGTVGAYYRLDLTVVEKSGKTELTISAPVRSIVGRIKSSHEEEKRVLNKIADLLRREDFEMTNVGTTE